MSEMRNKITGEVIGYRDWLRTSWLATFQMDDQMKADWIRWELEELAKKEGICITGRSP